MRLFSNRLNQKFSGIILLVLFLASCTHLSSAKLTQTAVSSSPTLTLTVAPGNIEDDISATGTVSAQENQTPTPPVYEIRAIDQAEIVLIPEGPFTMGCDPDHNGGFPCNFDELPLHEVYLSAYKIDKYEVTNAQYQACVEAGACTEPLYKYSASRTSYYGNPAYQDYPMVSVSWGEASAYCAWVGGRLPTEAEWEKAARGTAVIAYPWGDQDPNCQLANSANNATGELCLTDTAAVGSYPLGMSEYGVYDMAGNVWEWVSDWYGSSYYAISPYENPTGVEDGTEKVVRGGSWDYSWNKIRVVYNSNHSPDERRVDFGFRCVNPIESD